MESLDPLGEIAIIGMSCRFPDAANPAAFWNNLRAGRESVTRLGDAEIEAAGVAAERRRRPDYVAAGVLLEGIDRFDAEFFRFSPQEAALTDPQHRLFLECAWEAFENAGYVPGSRSERTGVYASAGMNTYLLFQLMANRDLLANGDRFALMIGNDKDFLATRTSYKLDLTGPSVSVQTACSSSLVAVHLACQSLLAGECTMALAGGAAVRVPQRTGYLYQQGAIFSPDGHCRAFDAAGEGTIFGSGVGVVLLKPLAQALADGDFIHAVIKGSAINNDGAAKVGYTAPSLDAQSAVIAEALAIAGVSPDTVGYVEAHGTATPMGDPIEVAALSKAFRAGTARRGYCAIGSVKTNVGHLDAAAGVAGLIKTVLALQHRELPASLHFVRPNPKIDFEASPFFVNTRLAPWAAADGHRRAGVSSFGVGGTNAHVVLEEAPPRAPGAAIRPCHLLTLSARSAPALKAAALELADFLERRSDDDLADVAYTMQVGRKAFDHRAAFGCRHAADAVVALRRMAECTPAPPVPAAAPALAFLFPGQGSQRLEMGLALYRTEPMFRKVFDEGAALLRRHAGIEAAAILYPAAADRATAQAALDCTSVAQPALFLVEYALARTLMDWGLRPAALLGHSVGEFVAACIAGVFTFDDAIRLLAIRGRLVEALPRGAMLAIALAEKDARAWLPADCAIAAINGPALCVAAGPASSIASVEQRLADAAIGARRLNTSHAFHSPMMEPAIVEFAGAVAGVVLAPPGIPLLSGSTGTWMTATQATDPWYWARHLRRCVRFDGGLVELLRQPNTLVIEVGPDAGLARLARRRGARGSIVAMRQADASTADDEVLIGAAGGLWMHGAPIDWTRFHAGEHLRRVPLPTYPFERRRHWIEADAASAPAPAAMAAAAPEAGPAALAAAAPAADVSRWFGVPTWKRTLPASPGADVAGRWLIFADARGVAAALAQRLRDDGRDVFSVHRGGTLARSSPHDLVLDAEEPPAYDRIVAAFATETAGPHRIVHLWSLDRAGDEDFAAVQAAGFDSVLLLAQALGRLPAPPELSLTAVSCGIHDIAGDETLCAAQATLLGAVLVLPQEVPGMACRSVDLDGGDGRSDRVARAADALYREVTSAHDDAIVGYRNGHRWVREFVPVVLPPAREPGGLRVGGTYLITGGLGGIGLALAEHLARNFQARLILVGRSPLPPEETWEAWLRDRPADEPTGGRISRVRALRQLGAQVLVQQADVGDFVQLQRCVEAGRARFGRIDGVFHAAGVAGGAMIQRRTPEAASAVLRPKVIGALHLHRLLVAAPPDFLVLFSSIAAVGGGLGQVDYCAANAFLDAYAQQCMRTSPMRTIAIAWDGWKETGMAFEAARGRRERPLMPAAPRGPVEADPPHRRITTLRIDAQDWRLDQHRILGGRAVLPGTALLEMAWKAAGRMPSDGRRFAFGDVLFIAPLVLDTGAQADLRIVFDGDADDLRFTASSHLDGEPATAWRLHASGRILDVSAPHAAGGPIDPLPADDGSAVDISDDTRADLARRGFGSRWHSLRRARSGAGFLVGELELADEFLGDLEDHPLHPALLDVATGFARFHRPDGRDYLPLSYGRLVIHAPLVSRIVSRIRPREDAAGADGLLLVDVDIFDAQGALLVSAVDFAMRRLEPDRRSPAQDPVAAALQARLREGLSSAGALDALERILDAGVAPNVLVSARSLAAAIAPAAGLQPRLDTVAPATSASRGPLTDLQQRIAALWREALGIAEIGAGDDFFALGGDSVLALQIVARGRAAGLLLTPQMLFSNPTVAGLAARLEGLLPAAAEPSPATPAGERFSLSGLSDDQLGALAESIDRYDEV